MRTTKVQKGICRRTQQRGDNWAVFRDAAGRQWYTLLSADMPLPLGTYTLVDGCGQCEQRGRLPPSLVACEDQ